MLTAKKLGEQCFYDLTCLHNDDNSVCKQIDHNAMCQCRDDFHEVTHSKPTRRTFCTQGKVFPYDKAALVEISSGLHGLQIG